VALFCIPLATTFSVTATAEEEDPANLAGLLTNYLAFTLNEGISTPLSKKLSGIARWNDAIRAEIRGSIDHLATDRNASDDVIDLPDLVFNDVPDALKSAVASTFKSLGDLQSHVRVESTPHGANAIIVAVDTSTGPNDYSTVSREPLEAALLGSGRHRFGIIGDAADFSTFISRTGDNTNDDQLCSALAYFTEDWTIVSAKMLVSRPVFESMMSDGRSALAEHSLLVCAAAMMGLNVQSPVSGELSSATLIHALHTLYGDRVSIGEASLSRIKEMVGER
jgi:hypothetical protein